MLIKPGQKRAYLPNMGTGGSASFRAPASRTGQIMDELI